MTSKIGYGQMAILLIISRVFSEAMNFPIESASYGMQRFTVVLISKIIIFSMYIPVILIAKKYPGESFFSLIAKKSKAAGMIIGFIFIIELLSAGTLTSVKLEFYVTNTMMPSASVFAIILLLVLAALYGTLKGIQAIARTGIAVALMFGLLLVLVIISLAPKMNVTLLYPAFVDNEKTLFREILSEVSKNNEILIFAVLSEHVRKKGWKSVMIGVPVVLGLTLLTTLLYNTVLGEYMNLLNFPFYTLASLSDAVLFQRLDGIDAAIWTVTAIIKITLLTLCISTILTRLFSENVGKISKFVALAIVFACGSFFALNKDFLIQTRFISESALPLLTLGTIIPLIVFFVIKGGKGHARKEAFDTLE